MKSLGNEVRKYFYKYWKKMSEKQIRKHYFNHYEKEIAYFEKYTDKKPKSTIKKEMRVLRKYWGCYPFQYIRYGMYKNTCTMSLQEMKDFIPNYFAYYLYFPKFFKHYIIISDDKELSFKLFESNNIPQPTTIFQYKNQFFYNKTKDIINEVEVDQMIENSKSKTLFFKPTLGLGGKGIWVFNKKENVFVDDKNQILNAELIKNNLKKEDNYLMQEGIVQHEELNKIYPTAVNTFRIMTKTDKGKVKILFAMLRMGQGGIQLDNASLAGLVCKVNPETGKFDEHGITSLQRTMKEHPDTKFVFKGYQFPYWEEVKDCIINAAQKIDELGFIGWDLAYSESGPQIIEVNAGAGLEYLQDSHGGVREAYEIDDPKKYWYYPNFALKDI